MIYSVKKIKGKGRGKLLGFPTINFEIPKNFQEADGIYAAWVWVNGKKYKGALHYGPIPTFGEPLKSLEVFLLDIHDENVTDLDKADCKIELIRKTRDIKFFESPDALVEQMKADIQQIQRLF